MFDIYGIGNALVDVEIQVTASDLEKMDIQKGVMTLIDKNKLEQLKATFLSQHVKRACGGSAANTIIGATQLGSHCFFSAKVAEDDMGHFYAKDLVDHGVRTSLDSGDFPDGITGVCFVFVTPDADRTMCTYLGISSEFDESRLDLESISRSKILYTEGYLTCTGPSLKAALKAKEVAKLAGVKLALSLSDPSMLSFFYDGISQLAENVDILFCNKDEAMAYTKESTLSNVISRFKAQFPLSVVTLGSDGALIVSADDVYSISGHQVKAVDTTGAGDSFAAAFLHAVSKGFSLEEAGRLATFMSAQVVSTYGPRLHETELKTVKQFYAKELA